MALAILAFVPTSFADEITVAPGTPGAINAAISNASDGDHIQLLAGTYQEETVIDTQGKAIRITGTIDPGNGRLLSIIDGQDSHRVFQCENNEGYGTVLQNLKIVNGLHLEGAGLYCGAKRGSGSESRPLVENCWFSGHNKSLDDGITIKSSDESGDLGCPFGILFLKLRNVVICGNGGTDIDGCVVTDGIWVEETCQDCDDDGILGPEFCVTGDVTPVDLIVIYDPSGSTGNKSNPFCTDILQTVANRLEGEFDLRSGWVSVVESNFAGGDSCETWVMPLWTPVPLCYESERTIDDLDGEEWGDATAVMTTPYEKHLLGQFDGWQERDAVLILVTVSDEGPQNGGTDGGACDYGDYASVRNLVQQATLQNVQIIPVPTSGTPSCVYDPDEVDSLMQFVAEKTDGGVLDARDWNPSVPASNEALANDFEQLIRTAIANSPRIIECPDCLGDLNGDGLVDGSDLSQLLAFWGQSDSIADVDQDGIVDGLDLSIVLGAWGGCSK